MNSQIDNEPKKKKKEYSEGKTTKQKNKMVKANSREKEGLKPSFQK